MSDASLPADSTPKAKKTPAKRQRRNYAGELIELQANVKVAVRILRSHIGLTGAEESVLPLVVDLLEGKD